jgi:hypothetical protein
MVIHGQCFIDPDVAGKLESANLALLVTILGKSGAPQQVRRVVTHAAAIAWMHRSMPSGGACKENSCSQVFSDMEASAPAVQQQQLNLDSANDGYERFDFPPASQMSQASYASYNHDAMSGRLQQHHHWQQQQWQQQQQQQQWQQQQQPLCCSCFMGPFAAIKGEIAHHCLRCKKPLHGGLCGTQAEEAFPNERTPGGSLVCFLCFAGVPFAE